MEKKINIDLKSLFIGFLLAVIAFMLLGAGSGVMDVRIVGADSYGSYKIPVKIVAVDTGDQLKVKVESLNSSLDFPVEIVDIDTYDVLNVKVKD